MALSRVASLAGLFPIGNYAKAVFKVNNAAANEYGRLRAEKQFPFANLMKQCYQKNW